jgi:hypothetical protein
VIEERFLRHLALWLAAWAGLFFAFTLLVDPYGVSPLKVSWSHFNRYKPKRLEIDRLIKPYEVWQHAPRTVFLGTSRIHQSIDPAVLDATRFAPAYNASIPASSLRMNVAHLRQYVRLDPNVRTVVVELFFYNFIRQAGQEEPPPQTLADLARNTAGLFISNDALWHSILTVGFNLARNQPHFEIMPGGYFSYPPGHDPSGPFAAYAAGIWKYHAARHGRMELYEPAFEAVEQLIELAREHDLELIFILTPNHAYDDWYLESIGAWDAVRQWLARVSAHATVYSFSQPNGWVYEPVGKEMRYWYDPYHFSLEMGAAMERTLAGLPRDGAPANFAQRMTPELVDAHVAARRRAIREWARAHPEFVASLAAERRKAGAVARP